MFLKCKYPPTLQAAASSKVKILSTINVLLFRLNSREWIAQLTREHQQQAASDHNERCDYVMQTDTNTRMRGMLHGD